MAYCHRCGHWDALDAAAMCAACRASWQPAGPAPADLGTRRQPLGPRGGGGKPARGRRRVSHPL